MNRASRLYSLLFPILFGADVYLGWKIHNAIDLLNIFSAVDFRLHTAGVIAYLLLHPFLLLLLKLLRVNGLVQIINKGHPLWDFLFGYAFWYGMVITVELLPIVLIFDILKLPFYPFFERLRAPWLQYEAYAILTVTGILLVTVFFRMVWDTVHIKVTRVTLVCPTLPSYLRRLRILHLSDIQLDRRTRRRKVRRYIKKGNKLKPDIAFFTGDLITNADDSTSLAANELSKLKARFGLYACLGDHDYWGDAEKVKRALIENNVLTLENANQFVKVGGDSILVTFITNTYANRPNYERLYFIMGQQPRGVFDIALAHQPTESIVELAAERGYHLFLSGHTHGGQYVVRPLGKVLCGPRFETKFYRGMHRVEKMLLSVNAGLGLTLIPVRYRAPAELTLIRVVQPSS